MNDQSTTTTKKIGRFAAGVLAFAAVAAAFLFLPLLTAGTTSGAAIEMAREVGAQAGAQTALEVLQGMPMLNSAGDHVYAEMYVNDGTGVVTTPTDGGVYALVEDAPLTAGETDGSGCITADIGAGSFTIAKRCGVGEVLLTACLSNLHGGNVGTTTTGAWHKNGTILTTAARIVKTEVVDAGTQGSAGCAQTVQDATLSDVFTFRLANSGATGVAQTTRQAALRIEKVLNK